jgi:glutamate-ammonia-ligase adenylyltransferase
MTSVRKPSQTARKGTSLAARLVVAPPLLSPPRARQAIADWLEALSESEAESGKRLTAIFSAHSKAQKLIEAVAENSPFLWDLASRAPARLALILESDPDARFATLLADAGEAIAASDSEADAMHCLRRLKAEAALLIALADIGGVWQLPRVTQAVTQLADVAITLALRFLLARATDDGKFRPTDPSDPLADCGYVALAMGKMGAFELNYSSDVDLICLYDPQTTRLAPGVEAAPFYIRLTRNLARMLQERTVDGYVFRVDLRLRPDPGLTQIALALPAALDFYESV